MGYLKKEKENSIGSEALPTSIKDLPTHTTFMFWVLHLRVTCTSTACKLEETCLENVLLAQEQYAQLTAAEVDHHTRAMDAQVSTL